MPEIITCPDCGRTLRVPDHLLGKKVKCPSCQVLFTASAGSPSKVSRPAPPPQEEIVDPIEEEEDRRRPPRDAVVRRDDYDDRRPRRRDDDDRRIRRRDDDYDDEPRSRRRDEDYYEDDYGPSPRDIREGWRKVAAGINLTMIGTWVWIGGAVFLGIGLLIGGLLLGSTILSAIGMGGPPSRMFGERLAAGAIILFITVVIFGLCSLAELILRLIGYGMCMGLPAIRGTSLKPLAITAFSLAAAEAAFRLSGCGWGFFSGASAGMGGVAIMPGGGNFMGLIGSLLGLAAFIVFLFFGRSAALQAKDRGLAGTFIAVLIAFCIYYVVMVVGSFGLGVALGVSAVSAATARTPSGAAATIGTFGVIAMILGGLLFVAYLGMEIWYIFVLQRLRDDVQRRLSK